MSFKSFLDSRFNTIRGYRMDKWLFQFGMVAIFVWLFVVASHYDFSMNRYECGNYDGCENPFYKPADWTNQEHLPMGVYGFTPDWYFNSVSYVSFGSLILLFVINHFLYNRGQNPIRRIFKHFEQTMDEKEGDNNDMPKM